MPDDTERSSSSRGTERLAPGDAETLAELMDGTSTLDEVDEATLGRLLRAVGPEELLHVIGTSPKLFDTSAERTPVEAPRREVARMRASSRTALALAAGVLIAAGAGLT